MKVIQIVKTNEGAKWAFEQAKWLYTNGVHIITVLPSGIGGMAEKYKSEGMELRVCDFSLPLMRPWKFFKRLKEIKTFINEEKPDLIHCHFVTNIMMLRLALRQSQIPRLFQVPGPLHLENVIFKKAEIMLAQSNDYWAGACKKTCQIYLASKIHSNKVFLAYYGGYGGKSCEQYKESKKLHREFNISDDKILVGMVSYFYKPKKYLMQSKGIKGHEDFIDAISQLRKKRPTITGIIIGDAWGSSKKYVQKVKKYADKKCMGGFIFTGYREDIKDIYRELNIAVHPSHSENLGGAAESLAAGVPTISTNVGGFTDIVIDNITGYTVPPRDPKSLEYVINKMIEYPDKAKQMGILGMNLVHDLLDIENTGKQMLRIYNKIIYGETE